MRLQFARCVCVSQIVRVEAVWLLLMMNFDVRTSPMNIDVEASRLHTGAEGGKMAAV